MVTVNNRDVSDAFEHIPSLEEVGKGIEVMAKEVPENVVTALRKHLLSIAVGKSPPLLAGEVAIMASQCLSSVLHHFLDGKEISSGNNN